MKSGGLIFLTILLCYNLCPAQTESEIDSLLSRIAETKNSKEITKTEPARKIIAFGKNALQIIAGFFTDSTQTKVKSECQERYLAKGEVAIILADQIEFMPYAKLTDVQNCLLSFCEDNPNLIEYYLWAIKTDGIHNFQKRYVDWLNSEKHKSYKPLFVRLTEKEIERRERKKARKEKRKKRQTERK
ncbi:hypothetical protein ABV409_11075 [Flagellimonas sp. DF-77]|uniref:hypothetical protein n=1 Tax=Flagellimonas algarum TaxID=3230298 RepID=UPI003392C3EA